MKKCENKDKDKDKENEASHEISGISFTLKQALLDSISSTDSILTLSDFEHELLNRVNNYRTTKGRSSLSVDNSLLLAAKKHNDLMSLYNILSHQLPSELPLAMFGSNNDRYDSVKYNWIFAAENIARNYQTPGAVMSAWIGCPKDNAILLSPDAHNIGIAHNSNGNFWTLNFGSKNIPRKK